MDAFVQLKPQERRIYFEKTATPGNLSAYIVEKDFWVCWTLKQLFGLPEIGLHLIFKGGTALSKVFGMIERFSEDIDVSIDRGYLGFGGVNEPEAGGSNKEKQRRVDALKVACQRKIAEELEPALRAVMAGKIRAGEAWSLVSDPTDPDLQTLLFQYPTVFPPEESRYIRRAVKIEMGARADHWPCDTKPITAYVAERFPAGFREVSYPVKVLSVERTFWEKATILHAEYHRPADKELPARLSRHYSDVSELIRKGVANDAAAHLDLLARVVQHKTLFFRSSWANYGTATPGALRIAPPEHRLKSLRDDYAKMQEMFFAEPPEFDAVIAVLKQWESEFNKK